MEYLGKAICIKTQNKKYLYMISSQYHIQILTCLRVCAGFHELSVYPKKELPFFILFTAGLCSFTALLALLTYQYPEPMGLIAKTVPAVSYY